ncbi:hypothetical protein, partial [Bordetella pertussis]|uniref:hypothetical protein n=1 Tax=Bordetella pertussis TaxID=520 RepID=UPI0012B16C9B
ERDAALAGERAVAQLDRALQALRACESGQILVAQTDAYLIDFEGEPARPMAERRQLSSPFKDVAGILRSF